MWGAPEGRKKPVRRTEGAFLPPLRGWVRLSPRPTAYAVGYNLSALRAWDLGGVLRTGTLNLTPMARNL